MDAAGLASAAGHGQLPLGSGEALVSVGVGALVFGIVVYDAYRTHLRG